MHEDNRLLGANADMNPDQIRIRKQIAGRNAY